MPCACNLYWACALTIVAYRSSRAWGHSCNIFGKQKIRKNLERYLLWNEEFNSAIIPVIGDLAKPSLGLSEATV